MTDYSQVRAIAESYLDGETARDDAAQQIGALLGGAVGESGDEQRLAELMEAVQPETTAPCWITLSFAVCTSDRLCG